MQHQSLLDVPERNYSEMKEHITYNTFSSLLFIIYQVEKKWKDEINRMVNKKKFHIWSTRNDVMNLRKIKFVSPMDRKKMWKETRSFYQDFAKSFLTLLTHEIFVQTNFSFFKENFQIKNFSNSSLHFQIHVIANS